MLRKPEYGRILFESDSGNAGGNAGTSGASGTGTPPSSGESEAVTFTEAQQKEINRLIGQARKEGRTAAEQAAQDAETARLAVQAITDQEAKGQYETAKQALTTERDGYKAELDATKASLDAANVVIAAQVAVMKGDLPAELLGGYPETGSPLDQLAWLKDRQSVFDAAKAVAGAAGANVTRLPQTPKGGNQNATDAAYEAMKGRISI